ncbi:CREB3 regulatory factor [Petromyzon marinus]
MSVLRAIKQEIVRRVQQQQQHGAIHEAESMTAKLERLINSSLGQMVAGHTPEFVNLVLERVTGGDLSGGLRPALGAAAGAAGALSRPSLAPSSGD